MRMHEPRNSDNRRTRGNGRRARQIDRRDAGAVSTLMACRLRSGTALLLLAAVAHGTRLTARNNSLILNGETTPFVLRAVLYSPTPWGYDDELYYQTGVYASTYAALFERDLDLIATLGANAVRLHGFMGIADQVRARNHHPQHFCSPSPFSRLLARHRHARR